MDTNTYKPCLYIESTGTQYIDTGFIPNQNTRVVAEILALVGTSTNWVFGARKSSSSNYYGFACSSAGNYATGYGNGDSAISASYNQTEPFVLDKNKNNTYINGELVNTRTYANFTAPKSLALFACNTNGTITCGKIKLYSCKIYDNDILVRDYRPVMRNDGVCGLYDSVNNVFYFSQADNFVAGFKSNYKKCFRRRLLAGKETDDFDSTNYMTITALEDGFQASFSKEGLSYTLDGSTWVPLTANTNTPAINAGQKIAFKGKITNKSGIGMFTTSHKCNLSGNCMSLTHEDSAADAYTCQARQFKSIFRNCKIVEVSADFLPATTLAISCYSGMFGGCTLLTTAPNLPATTLAESCYDSMFSYCSSLTTAPELPATVLDRYCYQYMFHSCYALTTAPELPATTLTKSCYKYMFYGTSLTTAPNLPATTLAESCYDSMFSYCSKITYIKMLATNISANECLDEWTRGVASTGTFVKKAGVSIPTGSSGIPEGWAVQEV